MYHIKSDKRSHKSAALLCEGLAAMLNAMLLSIVKVWVENGGQEPVETLYQILKSNLSLIQNHL